MTYDEYTGLITKMLGAPIVDVEVASEIKSYVDIAFLEIKPSLSTTKYMTLPYSPVINLEDKGVYTIVNILKGDVSTTTSLTDETFLFGNSSNLIINGTIGYGGTLDGVAISMLQRQVLNTLNATSDLDFVYKKPYLYVTQSSPESSEITLEYVPDYKNAEEVDDPYWVNLLFRLALAHTKIALGRARGKFRVSSVPYELDADTLLSEGSQELSEIRTKLDESSDLLYPLD